MPDGFTAIRDNAFRHLGRRPDLRRNLLVSATGLLADV
jgi:hypothetical protein